MLPWLPTRDELSATNQPQVLKAKEAVSRKFNLPLVNVTPGITGKSVYLEGDPVHFGRERESNYRRGVI